jgi:hypothetical protein
MVDYHRRNTPPRTGEGSLLVAVACRDTGRGDDLGFLGRPAFPSPEEIYMIGDRDWGGLCCSP